LHFRHVKVNTTTNIVSSACVTILSFTQLTRLPLDDNLFHHSFQTIIVDEMATIQTKKVFLERLKKLKSIYWLALTGVPINLNLKKIVPFHENCFIYRNQEAKLRPPQYQLISSELPNECKPQYNQLIDQYPDPKLAFLYLRKCTSSFRVPSLVAHIHSLTKPCKIAIFSEFNETLMLLQIHLGSSLCIGKVDSSTPKKARFQLLQQFQSQTGTSCILCSRNIVGIGNDLGFVDVLIIAEPAYKKEDDLQLIGRITRLGQSPSFYENQLVIQFLYQSTCEEKLYQCTH